jgi:hypothetical protein
MTVGNKAGSGDGAQQPLGGLSGREAVHRLKREGYNELPSAKQRTVLHIGGVYIPDRIGRNGGCWPGAAPRWARYFTFPSCSAFSISHRSMPPA